MYPYRKSSLSFFFSGAVDILFHTIYLCTFDILHGQTDWQPLTAVAAAATAAIPAIESNHVGVNDVTPNNNIISLHIYINNNVYIYLTR